MVMIRMNESYNKDSNSCMQQLNKNAVIRVSSQTITVLHCQLLQFFWKSFHFEIPYFPTEKKEHILYFPL